MATKKEEKTNETPMQYAVGRRKRAVARVRLFAGKGESVINGKTLEQFVVSKAQLTEFMKPIVLGGINDEHYFTAKVVGGGQAGQLGAVQLGISRCIAKINDDLKATMRSEGLLTRDPREKERKKVYHISARKSPQFSKR
jgi:small subunit ribosomal protein S9